MRVVICYDIKDDKIRQRLAKYLERMAVRVQYSVFLSDFTNTQINRVRSFGDRLLKEGEYGSLIIFKLRDDDELGQRFLPASCVYI